MRISDILAAEPEPEAEAAPPLTRAHQALLDTLTGLMTTARGSDHPLIRLFEGILPSLTKDLARVPEEDIRRVCADFAAKLSAIATAEEEVNP